MSSNDPFCRLASLPQVHVVLVEPENNLNIGSVARAMSNLGVGNLHLVAPPDFRPERALTTACWASEIVHGAKIHATLEAALEPMQEVVGFTARHGKYRPGQTFLPNWIEHVRAEGLTETALVFGPERTGLRMEHVELCRWLVRIPSSEENPAFNLAQSVLLALYEISKLTWEDFSREHLRELPSWNDYYQLDRLMTDILDRCGFYGKSSPEPIPGLVRNLVRRMNPDAREMRVLLGMFGKIDRTLIRHKIGDEGD